MSEHKIKQSAYDIKFYPDKDLEGAEPTTVCVPERSEILDTIDLAGYTGKWEIYQKGDLLFESENLDPAEFMNWLGNEQWILDR